MSEYLSEEEQIARIKSWWDTNGTSVIVAVVVGVVAIVGWRWYGGYTVEQAEQAARSYAAYQTAEQADKAAAAATVATQHGGSAYHVFVLFDQARSALADGEGAAAESHLVEIVEGAADPLLTDLARIRLAKVQQQLDRFNRQYEGKALSRAELETFLGAGHEATDMILSNLNRAAELVQSFKQVSVDQSAEDLRSFEVGEYLREALLSLRPKLKQGGHELELFCPVALEMRSYPGVLAQVATNLVMNSLLHGFEDREGGQIVLNIDEVGKMVRILYRDDGRGMSSEQVRKIYDPFYTTKRGRGGSGLGMNIVFNLVTQKLGGTIECQSAEGQGTAFVIELPRRVRKGTKKPDVPDGVLAKV